MCSPFVPEDEERALDRQVVGLAAAACEHDLVEATVEQSGNLAPGILQRSFRRCARPMTAGRIAESVIEECRHGGSIGWGSRMCVTKPAASIRSRSGVNVPLSR